MNKTLLLIFYLISQTVTGQLLTNNKWSNKTIDFEISTGSKSGYDNDLKKTISKLGFGLIKGHSSIDDPDSFSWIEFKNNKICGTASSRATDKST